MSEQDGVVVVWLIVTEGKEMEELLARALEMLGGNRAIGLELPPTFRTLHTFPTFLISYILSSIIDAITIPLTSNRI